MVEHILCLVCVCINVLIRASVVCEYKDRAFLIEISSSVSVKYFLRKPCPFCQK